MRELFIPLFSFLCRDGTRWAEARSNQCGHLAPPGSALSYARCTARPDRHFQTALVESCQKAVCGRALSQQSFVRRRFDAAIRRYWQPLVSACFATSNFAGLGHSREIIHEEDSFPRDLAWMWQSGSERRGVATDKVALQKRREDGSPLVSHGIC